MGPPARADTASLFDISSSLIRAKRRTLAMAQQRQAHTSTGPETTNMKTPFDAENEQPDEPDWNELIDALEAAEKWLTSEKGLDEANCILKTEAIALALGVLTGTSSEKTYDDLVRDFFERVNRATFWLAGACKDSGLRAWIGRFCIDSRLEWERMRKIAEIAGTNQRA